MNRGRSRLADRWWFWGAATGQRNTTQMQRLCMTGACVREREREREAEMQRCMLDKKTQWRNQSKGASQKYLTA